jgi:Zn ribbon nucleic-acid-binding protein
MTKLHVCPCCNGQGVLHDVQESEEQLLECVECEATGKVTKAHRDELLEWQGKCRMRPLGAGRTTPAQ